MRAICSVCLKCTFSNASLVSLTIQVVHQDGEVCSTPKECSVITQSNYETTKLLLTINQTKSSFTRTLIRVSKLSADDYGIVLGPEIVTNSTPRSIETHFNTTLQIIAAVYQSNCPLDTFYTKLQPVQNVTRL